MGSHPDLLLLIIETRQSRARGYQRAYAQLEICIDRLETGNATLRSETYANSLNKLITALLVAIGPCST